MTKSIKPTGEILSEAHARLHLFNNQIFRVTLLVDTLDAKTEKERAHDSDLAAIISQIQSAAFEAASSGAALMSLIRHAESSQM